MRLVAQEDGFGCGVACVASLLGLSYDEALQLFSNSLAAKDVGYPCKEVIRCLGTSHKQYKLKYAPKFRDELPDLSIVFVKKGGRYTAGHYLLKTKRGWMNPWTNIPAWPAVAGYDSKLPGRVQFVLIPDNG